MVILILSSRLILGLLRFHEKKISNQTKIVNFKKLPSIPLHWKSIM